MAMIFRPKQVPIRYKELHEKIRRRGVRLDKICNVYRGIWTGVLHIFIVSSEEIEKYEIEKGALKPILRGKDIGPFRYQWNDKWVIYTNQKDFEKKYPNTIEYLKKYKTVLERRGAVWVYRKKWWELEDPLTPEMFEVEKILSPYISKFNAFAYEEGKYYTMDSTAIIRFWFNENEIRSYITKWKEVNEPEIDVEEFINESKNIMKELGTGTDSLLYVLGILNSEVIEFYYKLYAQRLTKKGMKRISGKYYLYIPPDLNVLPIPISSSGTKQEIVAQVKKIMSVAKNLNNAEGEEKRRIEEEVLLLVSELNEKVYDIFELSDEERAIIQAYVLRKR